MRETKRTVEHSEEEWRRILSEEQYRILREKGTERPYSGRFLYNKRSGVYVCAACGNELFGSEAKFDSGSGWPSFYGARSDSSVETQEDSSLFMKRTEVLCRRCGSHLGHVFDHETSPTGMRYCINSAALDFRADKDKKRGE